MSKAKCKACGDIIESKHRHDSVTCKCGKIFLDGGNDYFRCGYPEGKMEDWIEIIKDVPAPGTNEPKGGAAA